MSFFKKLVKGLLGMPDDSAAKESARLAEEQLRQQEERLKLQATNDAQNVTTMEDSTLMGSTEGGTYRRKKAATGGFGSGSNLGLNV